MKTLFSLTRDQFDNFHQYVATDLRKSANRTTKDALAMYFIKLRLNLPQKVIRILFGISTQSKVSEAITAVSESLFRRFTPTFLGYRHLNETQLQSHQSEFLRTIFGLTPAANIIVADGTYIFMQKSSGSLVFFISNYLLFPLFNFYYSMIDFDIQRLTWSSHKNRNLVKAMMLVCPDGYIYNAECCFFANGDNNDAKIFEALLSKNNEDSLSSFLKSGDAMLLDKGFRDVLPRIESLGVHTFMPQFMSKDQKQLTTDLMFLAKLQWEDLLWKQSMED